RHATMDGQFTSLCRLLSSSDPIVQGSSHSKDLFNSPMRIVASTARCDGVGLERHHIVNFDLSGLLQEVVVLPAFFPNEHCQQRRRRTLQADVPNHSHSSFAGASSRNAAAVEAPMRLCWLLV